jgi:hypothetical protein
VITVTPSSTCPAVPGTLSIPYGTALPLTCPTATAVDESGNDMTLAGRWAFTDQATGLAIAPGAVLTGGSHTILFTFTPDDTTDYKMPKVEKVKVDVSAITPLVTFTPPPTIATGSTIPDWTANGDATVATNPNNGAAIPGTWTFSPTVGSLVTARAGRILTFKAVFVPTDLKSYTRAAATPVTVTVVVAASN